ncbi:MAG: L-2-amino-thiazoline-4-carboxylic acid hydrolase [Candidatus Hermodarchaeota archaeon]
MKNFEKELLILSNLLIKEFNEEKINAMLERMKNEYEKIIPEIPYIGGYKNPMTLLLISGMSDLAIFRTLEKEGFTLREIGQLFYKFSDERNKRRKKNLEKTGKDPSNYPFELEYMDITKKLSEHSQKKEYPDDWTSDYIEGDGKSFEWGFNFHQCGINNVYKRLGAEKYIPFICLSDFSEANILGFGFSRTQTLGNGDPICDHRYIKNYKTPQAWPPDKLKEFKLKLD